MILGSTFASADAFNTCADEDCDWVRSTFRRPLLLHPDDDAIRWTVEAILLAGAPLLCKAMLRLR